MSRNEACTIAQGDFIKKLHKNLPPKLRGSCCRTPALVDLFEVNKNVELVSKDKLDKCNKVLAKSLWAS